MYLFDFGFYVAPGGPLMGGEPVVRLMAVSPRAKERKRAKDFGPLYRFFVNGVPLSEFRRPVSEGGFGGEEGAAEKAKAHWKTPYKFDPIPLEFEALEARLQEVDSHALEIEGELCTDDDALVRKMFCGWNEANRAYGLRPEQKRGVSWLLAQYLLSEGKGGCLLADDMGLGKTLQFLMALRVLFLENLRASGEAGFFYVVRKGSLDPALKAEFRKWMPGLEFQTMKKLADRPVLPEDRTKPLVVFCTYTWFAEGMDVKHKKDRRKPKGDDGVSLGQPIAVIMDEATAIKGAASVDSRGQSLKFLAARKMSERSFLILLSGTPMENGKHSEMWSYLLCCGGLESVRKYNRYAFRYCGRTYVRMGSLGHWVDKDSTCTWELSQLMRSFMLCRKKRGRVKLPSVEFVNVPTEVTAESSEELSGIAARLSEIATEERRSSSLSKERVERLVKEKKKLVMDQLRWSGRGKIPAMQRYFGQLLDACPRAEDGSLVVEPMVIYAFHKDVFDAISEPFAERGVEFAMVRGVTGERRIRERDEQVMRFMRGEINVVFLSLVMGEGFNFQRACVGHVCEWIWQVGKMEQARGRLVRVGQESDVVRFYRHVGDAGSGSIDERVLQTLQKKQTRVRNAIVVEEAAASSSSKRRKITGQEAV